MNWKNEFDRIECRTDDGAISDYFNANKKTVKKVLAGVAAHPGVGARQGLCVVVNIPARRALVILGKPARYANRYALAKVGKPLSTDGIRARIDVVLPRIAHDPNLNKESGHYAAIELNGTGVRYFGDICFVLKTGVVKGSTLTLLRNSFDACFEPASGGFDGLSDEDQEFALQEMLGEWAGEWGTDAVHMAGAKIMMNAPETNRRMTIGQVSRGVLEDEDYIEVVMSKGFDQDDLSELRLTADDAAAEALIGDQARAGYPSSVASSLWRHRRRAIRRFAHKGGLDVRVVTSAGRARS